MDRKTRNRELARKAKAGDQSALESLIEENSGLIYRLAQPYLHLGGAEQEDIFQHGAIGIIRAVQTYDPDAGTEFGTWAWHQIRGELQRVGAFVDDLAVGAHQDKLTVNSSRDDLLNELGREPTDEELVSRVKERVSGRFSEEKILSLDRHQEPYSLDAELPGEDGDVGTMYDIVEDAYTVTPEDELISSEQESDFVAYIRRNLDPTRFVVIEMYFSIGRFRGEEFTLRDIAEVLGISPGTAYNYLQSALEALERDEVLWDLTQIIS